MKRIVLLALMVLSAVGCYDDAALWDQIMDHESRLVKLEALCNQMNTNIQSLQAIVTALQNNDYVTNVAPVKENGKDIGYTISFSKSGSVTIYHGADGKDGSNGKDGADGKDGHTPVIGIRQDSDGVWYWTLDGDWLLNDAGAKIPTTGADGKDGVNGTDGKDGADGKDGEDGADGKDGVTPQLKIEESYWYISYDNGLSWVKLDKAVGEDGKDGTDGVDGKDGDSFFKSVTQDSNSVYLTLADGTEFVLPKKGKLLKITLGEELVFCDTDEVISVDYVIQYNPADGPVKISTMSEGGYETEIQNQKTDAENGIAEGKVVITANANSSSGKVMVFAQDQGGHLAIGTIEVMDGINLSKDGTANSYIVSAAGSYGFTPTKGNSNESVGAIASAEALWETFGTNVTPNVGDLVKNVKYKNGVITFKTPDVFKEGNAVIAAKDASGTILWSWHIWFTDQPEGQVYYNNAGTMMDRNLGATSATPGDVGALGLLYQWGRKDPFLGSSSIHNDSMVKAKSTISWPSAVFSNSSTGTIGYAIANPTTFIGCYNNNYDWYYTGSESTDNTRWTASDNDKSIYDPCPVGWRVPDGGEDGVWSKALGSSSSFTQRSLYDSTNEGMNFSGKFGSASTIWYPASGYSFHYDGGLGNVGSSGRYWSASPDSNYYAFDMYFYSRGSVYPSGNYDYRPAGQSVRCIQE